MVYDSSRLMREYIDSQIAARRAKLQELDRQKLTVEAELHAYEEMLNHLDIPRPAATKNGSGDVHQRTPRTSPIPSEMTPAWRKILCGVEELGHSFDAADIVKIGNSVGAPTKMLNARSQIYQWEKKDIIQRVRKGKYKVVTKGHDAIRKVEGSNAGALEPS
jgi:hypothetical protein